jgi:hypothetical protein
LRARALRQQVSGRGKGRGQQNRKNYDRDRPSTGRRRSFFFLNGRIKNESVNGLETRPGWAYLERERIGTLGNLDEDEIVGALVGVILGELDPQAPGLDAHRRVALGIESSRATQNLGSDLILLECYAGMIKRMLGKVTEEFAERFRGVEAMTFNKLIYLLEALFAADGESVRDSHITGT